MFNTDIFSISVSNNRNIIYIPIRSVAFLADDESCKIIGKLRNISSVSETDQNTLIYKQLNTLGVIGGKEDDCPHLETIRRYKPIKTVILLTESCNLKCTYCYASAFPKKSTMSPMATKSAIDLVITNALVTKEKKAFITFLGGGEPTLYWANIVEVTEYAIQTCLQSNVMLHTVLVTNGTLLDKKKIQWIAKNINHVTLSFDILPEIQEKQRSFINGRNSHSRVLQTIENFSKLNCNVSIRSTITRDSAEHMTEMVEYIYNTTDIKKLHFEPLTEMGRSVETFTLAPVHAVFIREFMKAREKGKELGVEVECSISQSIDKLVSRACEIEFCVTADDVVTSCHRISRRDNNNSGVFQYGSYLNGKFVFDMSKINYLRSVNVERFEQCQNCFAKWNCGGDCAVSRIIDGDKILEQGIRCDLIRGLLKEMLIERVNEGNKK